MLTCITCSKQKEEDDGAPRAKDSVKSLTAQIKDMALKMSGSYKHSKKHYNPNMMYKRGGNYGSYPEFDTISEDGVPSYVQPSGGSSTTAWDFATQEYVAVQSNKSRFGLDSDLDHGLDEPKQWMAQVEPGVQITFMSLPTGGNDLKRIRFSREIFDKWQAQRWWGENYDRVMELYNVQRFNKQALNTPGGSEDENRDSSYSVSKNYYRTPDQGVNHNYNTGSSAYGIGGNKIEPSFDPSRTTTSSRDEPSISASNASEVDSEWIQQDEPGVYITIRQLVDGTRELRRVRFSRERFGEMNAKTWWEENRERIQTQYL
ncbi:protein BREVIS RADIX-like [Impatiens glandulifera]|uniref:protein BREVIS RADIX-like n=1 Tax=Impatiens glandulifera TaxID=253017 RepID=UPI001FB15577|nr:protein BREVIS RADIX-like [Impatiens glandulifera]XP_047323227.1 protein BREVIS RADIX-like [Impatiens glandulifera]